jgi:ribosomal protein S12 methylthiotransferase accessory factor
MYVTTGSGCHSTREVALARALTEAAQSRLTYICGARDDAGRDFFTRARDPQHVESVRWIVAHQAQESRKFGDIPSAVHTTFEHDVRWQLERLQRVGIDEVAAVDLSMAEFGIPVVRVVIPGLESMHDAPGYVPGARACRVEAPS